MSKYYGDEEKPSLESLILEHHGVVGMKWGVRRERELEYHKSIAAGKGSRRQRLNYGMNVAKMHELVRHGGDIQKVAAARVTKLEAQKARYEAGNATVRDNLRNLGKNVGASPYQIVTRGKVKNLTQS